MKLEIVNSWFCVWGGSQIIMKFLKIRLVLFSWRLATTAETVYSSLKDCLLRLGIPFDKCRGQAYDGARNFQGHKNGIAEKFQDDNAAAISVHCLAHCVNLCLQEIAVVSQPIKEALNFSMEIIQLILQSPKLPLNVFINSKIILLVQGSELYAQLGGLFTQVPCKQLLPIMNHYMKLWKLHPMAQMIAQDEPMVY